MWLLQLQTFVSDYLTFASDYCIWLWTYGYFGLTDWKPVFLLPVQVFFLVQAKEAFNFWIMGDKCAKVKRNYSMTWRVYGFWFRTATPFYGAMMMLHRFGLQDNEGFNFSEFNWASLCDIILTFYVMVIIKDVCSMLPFHEKMHNEWYHLHKTHHEIGTECAALSSTNIDPLDLIIENLCASVLILAVKWAFGFPVRIHMLSTLLSANLDVNVHSVNPYTSVFFNPVLDYVFRCNIAHNIHHGLNKDNYTFVPTANDA